MDADFWDFFNLFDKLIDRPRGFLKSLLPHRRSHKGRKVGKVKIEPGLWELRIKRGNGASQTGGDMERRCKEVGVEVYGRRVLNDEFICYIQRRQARWAEQVLLRAGIEFSPKYRWFDPRTPKWAGRHAGPVPTWASRNPDYTPIKPIGDTKGITGK